MTVGLAITRKDESPDDLRRVAYSCRNVAQARRLLAIELVKECHSRMDAATVAGMDRQSLRDWAHRSNTEYPDGQLDKAVQTWGRGPTTRISGTDAATSAQAT